MNNPPEDAMNHATPTPGNRWRLAAKSPDGGSEEKEPPQERLEPRWKETPAFRLAGTIAIPRKNTPGIEVPSLSLTLYFIACLLGFIASFDISVPRPVMLLGSAAIFIPLFFKSLQFPLPSLMALIIYIPYSKAVSGNLGGAVTGLNFTTVIMLLCFVSVSSVAQRGDPLTVLPRERSFRRLVVLFCILGAFSVIHTDISSSGFGPLSALVDYKRWLDPFLVFFVISYLVKTEEEGRLLVTLMVMSLVIIGLGTFEEHRINGMAHHLVRLTGIAQQANQMGAFYSNYLLIMIAFFMMKGLGLTRRFFLFLGLGGCLLGLFMTESRGDALSMAIALMFFFFVRSRVLFLGVVALLAVAILNAQYLPGGLGTRLQRTVVHQDQNSLDQTTTLDASARTRLALWTGAIKMIESHPVFGVGYKMFQSNIFRYVPHNDETAHLSVKNRDAHDAYLLIGAEMGIPTLLVFVYLLFSMFRVSLYSFWVSTDRFWKLVCLGTASTVVSLIITNIFGSRFNSMIVTGYLWALLAIILKIPIWQMNKMAEKKA
ncbi:MAG: O-antigen ligase family protein [Leptospirillum sp.]|jgi:O-antigen ligase